MEDKMAEFTVDELVRLLKECAGADENVRLEGDILDLAFGDLGYDSLALLNTISRIQRDYGIHIDDDTILDAETPRVLLKVINETLEQPVK
jgi:minimal PKS acyl carrier protein